MVEMSPITLAVILIGIVFVVAGPNWIAILRPDEESEEAASLARYTEWVARIWDFVHDAEQRLGPDVPGPQKLQHVLEYVEMFLPDLDTELARIIIESVVNQMKAERA